MLVKEIIKESQLLQEQIARFWVLLNYAIKTEGPGIGRLAEKALEWIASSVKGKANAADELARAWAMTAEKTDVTIASAIEAGKRQGVSQGIAREVLDDAERLAAQIFSKNSKKLIPQIKNASEVGQIWWGASTSLLNTALTTIGVGKPVLTMLYYIYEAYQKHDEGHPEYQGKKLQYIVQWEINKCLEEVIGLLAGRGTIAWALGPRGIQMLGPLGWGPIGKAFNLLNPGAQAAFQAWFISPAGQESFARWLVGTAVIPGTDTKVPFGPEFKQIIAFIGGEVVKTGYDAILRAMGSDKAQQPARAPENRSWRPKSSQEIGHGFKTD